MSLYVSNTHIKLLLIMLFNINYGRTGKKWMCLDLFAFGLMDVWWENEVLW